MDARMNETTPLIYIVDDENSIRKSLKRLMESEGLKAETFASAKEFLDFSYQDKSACLILDLHMPGMTGMELQEQLVESGRTCRSSSSPDMTMKKIIAR